MDSSRIFFDPNTSCHGGNMLFLGNSDSVFRGSIINMEENSKRNRPFFSSPEELYDDEYYDEQLPEKKRRLTPEQVHLLEKSFEAENKLETERKTQLAKILGLQPRQVAIWFQNRRARWKTKQLERDYDLLKSNYDSLLANYESMLKDNDKLKSEVVSLAEKFQDKEEAAGEPIPANKSELLHGNQMSDVGGLQYRMKVEDRLSTGSGGSAVMDEEGPQLVGSCDYYFPTDPFPAVWVDPLDHTVHTEEDDGSEDGQSYFSNVYGVVEQQQQEDGAPLSWWVWS